MFYGLNISASSLSSTESKHVEPLKTKSEEKPKTGVVKTEIKSIGDLDSKGSFWGDYNDTDTVSFENNGNILFMDIYLIVNMLKNISF